MQATSTNTDNSTEQNFVQELLNDYRIACLSREASLLGRKEVLTGKAKFGTLVMEKNWLKSL